MKKAVVSGYYGFDNFGDDAVLKVLIECFKDRFDLTVLSANPVKTRNCYGVEALYSFDYWGVFNKIRTSDVLISGGGSLLQDVTSFKSLLYYLLLIFLAGLFRKKIVIFAQGIGPLRRLTAKSLTKLALRNAKIITVRDQDSFDLLKSWGLNPMLVTDPVFSLPIQSCIRKKDKIGIQLRNFEGIDRIWLNNFANIINENFIDNHIVIYSLQDAIDLDVCKNFASLLKSKKVSIKKALCIDEVIKEIAGLDVLIAMRFHAALIGFRAGVKVLPIAYDKKVALLAQKAGVNYLELDNLENCQELINQLENIDTEFIKNRFENAKFDFSIFDDI